jgi:hemerythrin-like domain-containing protein
MKRDPALTSLSHDHHHALFVAQKLARSSPSTVEEALTALDAYWSADGAAHFRAEEEILFPAFAGHGDPYHPLVARALCDHVAIRHRIHTIDRGAPDMPALVELARLIQTHVRLEERQLFPLIEAALPAAELAALAGALEQAAAHG